MKHGEICAEVLEEKGILEMAGRFSGKMGEDYKLFRLACPHHDELEEVVGKTIAETFRDRKIKEIKVLEVGCGPGFTTEIILAADPRISVVAIDNEKDMIRQIKENLSAHNKERTTILLIDALEYLRKQKTEFFNVFASAFTLHNFDKTYREQFLREVYRVLKNGGLFVNADKYALEDKVAHQKSFDWELDMIRKVYSRAGRQDLADLWIEHYHQDNQPDLLMKEEFSISQMKSIGFSPIKKIYRAQMEAVIVARK